ncbi:hypothetical protein Tco_0721784 [Tanacetum coccineum]
MLVKMADMSKKAPMGIVENVLMKINNFIFPSDFMVIDMLGDPNETMILGRKGKTKMAEPGTEIESMKGISTMSSSNGIVIVIMRDGASKVLDSFKIGSDSSGINIYPYSRTLQKFSLKFENEVTQLANEYELKIGKKGYILDIFGKMLLQRRKRGLISPQLMDK